MKQKKKLLTSWLVCLLLLLLCGCGTQHKLRIKTDTAPIYNHFPSIPETDTMEWYSDVSEGIGLNTVRLYVFAHYESSEEIDRFLENVTVSDQAGSIDAAYFPDFAGGKNQWYEVQNVPYCFQEDIDAPRRMNTTVYVNEDHTCLYVFAIGD